MNIKAIISDIQFRFKENLATLDSIPMNRDDLIKDVLVVLSETIQEVILDALSNNLHYTAPPILTNKLDPAQVKSDSAAMIGIRQWDSEAIKLALITHREDPIELYAWSDFKSMWDFYYTIENNAALERFIASEPATPGLSRYGWKQDSIPF